MPYFRVKFKVSGANVGIWKGENEKVVLDLVAQKLIGSSYKEMIKSPRASPFVCEQWFPSIEDIAALYQSCKDDGDIVKTQTCFCALTGCLECYERCADALAAAINDGWDQHDSGAVNN